MVKFFVPEDNAEFGYEHSLQQRRLVAENLAEVQSKSIAQKYQKELRGSDGRLGFGHMFER